MSYIRGFFSHPFNALWGIIDINIPLPKMTIWASTQVEENCVLCGSASSSGKFMLWQTVQLPVIPYFIAFLWHHRIEIGIYLVCRMVRSPTYGIATTLKSSTWESTLNGRLIMSSVWDSMMLKIILDGPSAPPWYQVTAAKVNMYVAWTGSSPCLNMS